MRFTRAAKVAAFPLLAMVLVVALIACQGPAGPAGKDATAVPGTTGVTGKDAPDTLQAKAVDTVIFNSTVEDNETTTWAPSVMGADVIDLSAVFTGGAGDRKYRIETVLNTFDELGYTLLESILTVTVAIGAVADVQTTQDAVIRVEAVDADDNDAVASITVRANVAPALATGFETQEITVGTQTEYNASPDGDYYVTDNTPATDDTPEDKGDIVCETLNFCKLKVRATDGNLQDKFDWKVSTSDDTKVDVKAMRDPAGGRLDGIVEITGLEAGKDVLVRVWAVDKGMLPTAPDIGESNPDDDGVYLITVTVDGVPTLSLNAIEAVSLDIGDEDEVIGTVYDPEGANLTLDITEMPARARGTNVVATVNLDIEAGDADSSDGQEIHVDGENTGTVTFIVKAMEPDATETTPQQYAKHTFTVTVAQQ